MIRILFVIISAIAFCTSCATNPKGTTIQLIRNATLKIEYAGHTYLVDPMLSSQKSWMSFKDSDTKKLGNPTVDLTMSLEDILKDVQTVLLTHHHIDHFDDAAIKAISKSLPLVSQEFDKAKLLEEGFENIITVVDSVRVGKTTITKTGGVHGPANNPALLKRLGEVSGFVLQQEGYPTIYIVGDCLWDNEIRDNIRMYNPDIIITNSGGAIGMGSRILMDARDTAELAKFAPNAIVIAVHLEAIDHCPVKRSDIKKIAKDENLKIFIPEDGEIIKR